MGKCAIATCNRQHARRACYPSYRLLRGCANFRAQLLRTSTHGRGGKLGRNRGVGRDLGVALGVGVGLTLGDGVAVGVGVGVALGVGVGVGTPSGVTKA
jgi:hypothetical protein